MFDYDEYKHMQGHDQRPYIFLFRPTCSDGKIQKTVVLIRCRLTFSFLVHQRPFVVYCSQQDCALCYDDMRPPEGDLGIQVTSI